MTRERDRIQKNANKYVIKNCKSNYKLGSKYICGAPRIHHYLCQDCSDCITKQVIEKCKDSKLSYSNLEILRTACETNQAYGKANMAEQILQLFDIEEINK